jgi:hypothetical protein
LEAAAICANTSPQVDTAMQLTHATAMLLLLLPASS